MRVIKKTTLQKFWNEFPDSQMALMAWFKEAEKAFWKSPSDIKRQYRSASIIADNRVVFNICGNKYRLVVKINYGYGMVYIRFLGTHKQYDKVNVEEV